MKNDNIQTNELRNIQIKLKLIENPRGGNTKANQRT